MPYKGPVGDVLFQMVGGLRSGMGYVGCGSIDELRTETEFVRITAAGLRESHPARRDDHARGAELLVVGQGRSRQMSEYRIQIQKRTDLNSEFCILTSATL